MKKSRVPRLWGVIHLPPLPGSPGARQGSAQALEAAGKRAIQEAQALARAGFDGIVLENFGDIPFYAEKVPPETVASLAIIAAAVRQAAPRTPLCINVLRNDAFAALSIAAVTGCEFIRINVLSGVAATDQGIVTGRAAELLRERDRLGASVGILADAHVKHARSLSSTSIGLQVEELALRAGADAVIITGETTGRAVAASDLEEASTAAHHAKRPLLIGSGATPQNLQSLLRFADGIIVGSAIRQGGRAGAPLDPARMRAFLSAAKTKKTSPKRRSKR